MTLDVILSSADGLDAEALRRQVGALLPQPGIPFSDDDNLIEFGLDSLHVMRLVATLRQAGAEVTFSALIERPTIAAWWSLIRPTLVAVTACQSAAMPAEPEDGEPFALTDVQHAYWIGRRDDQPLGGVGCHAYLELDGRDVDPNRLEAAWRLLVRHHGMLRASFDREGRQRIRPDDQGAVIVVHDLRGLVGDEMDAALGAVRDRLSHRRLRVEDGEVAGLELSLLPDGATRLHLDLDLLVADVQSLRIILRDLAAAYARGAEPPAPAGWSFARYLAREEARKAAAEDADRAYWQARLADYAGGPALPLACPPEEVAQPRFRRRIHRLSPESWGELRRRAAARRLTPAMVLAAAYAEILAYWSDTPRFLLNLPLFDRQADSAGIEDVVADFTTLLLLAVDCAQALPFADRVAALQTALHADIAHAAYSGVRVQRDLARDRPGERVFAPVVFACNLGAPLIDTECRQVLGGLSSMISQTPQVWLDHQVYEVDGGLLLTWDSVDELFPGGLMDHMFAAYGRVVDDLAAADAAWDRPAADLLPPTQRDIRAAVNATATPVVERLLHRDILLRIHEHADRPAVFDGDTVLSYGVLGDRAARLAARLVAQGVAPAEAVAVSLERGADQLVAVLGVLMAGACYVPVSPAQPESRRRKILDTAGVRVTVTAEFLAASQKHAPLSEPVAVSADSPAYVIFTSGSTGEPKGVEIAHRAAVNTIDDITRRYRVGPSDRVLAVSALDFDLSVYDIFGLLGVGGAVVTVGEEQRRDASAWLGLIRRHGVTVWNSVPVLLDMLLVVAEGDGGGLPLRLALASGDWVGLDLPGRLAAATGGACRMVALGGATEAAIWSNAFEVGSAPPPGWPSIPYGLPLANQCYRVVDPQGRDCPDWVAGELWIGGAGVATGYRGDPELTARRFVQQGGRRWYRTGDLGRYRPDGILEFLGRADHQVKVRGHRIELGEIEAALHALPEIRHAVVVAVGRPLALAAALVLEAGERPDAVERIRAGLADRLPDYMVPPTLQVLEHLPLSANGKVDRKAAATILSVAVATGAETGEPPQGMLEQKVAEIWAEILGRDHIRRTDDFFLLGGDSLLATQVVTRLRQKGLSAEHPLRLLFAQPVLADFARGLTEGEATAAGNVTADLPARNEPFPLTEVQQAYVTGQDSGLPLSCGTTYFIELDGEGVDLVRFEAAWNTLVRRHEMLRAVLTGDGRQRILPEVPPLVMPVEALPDGDAMAAGRLLAARCRPAGTDRTRWPLFDLHAVRYGGGRCRIGLAFDYVMLDGLSVKLVLAELAELYRDPSAALPPVELSFRDYVLQVHPSAEDLGRDRAYWQARLDDLPPAPSLPLAVDPASVAPVRFRRRQAHLPAECWRILRARARSQGLTPSSLLLTAYAEILSRWSGGAALTLNLTLFDRQPVHPHMGRVLGDFTTLSPVAFRPQAGRGFADHARMMQQEVAEILEHRSVSSIWVQRQRARSLGLAAAALPVVFTSTLGLADDLLASPPPGFPVMTGGGFSETPQVWLDHQLYELDGGLLLTWDSVDDLFPDGLLDHMFAAYEHLLQTLAGDAALWGQAVPAELPPPQRQARDTANATQAPGGSRLLHDGFFAVAAAEPERVAVLEGDGVLSYGRLARHALQVAALLQERGVRPGDPVAVTVPRGAAQIIAVLGILAAGGCYVPVGEKQPPVRQARIHRIAGIRHVLLPLDLATAAKRLALAEPVAVSADCPAYVIFTSGSTGEPKGVEIAHRAAVNTIDDITRRYRVGPSDRVLAVSALDFDLSVYDVFGLLGVGGAVVTVGEEQRRDASAWLGLIRRHGVTVWNSVPVLLDMLLVVAEGDGGGLPLRLALASGDWVGLDLPGRLAAATGGACRMVALGGATEAAIWSNAFEVGSAPPPGWPSIPYGLPLANQCYRVVDPQGRDCPDWVAGELWIGGAGVATGYRGDPELTARRFVQQGGRRWYRTGDLGRYRPDGILEFLGRADHQVKVRGHRIELGEIEAALHALPEIRHAVVVAVGRPLALAAALVLEAGERPDAVERIRAGLADRLPDYMVPPTLQVLEHLPLSANGKVDRKAILQGLEQAQPSGQSRREPPRDALERVLAETWSAVLECGPVWRDDDFFQLGGDSLRATRIFQLLRTRGIGAETLPLRLLFTAPTLAALAERIRSLGEDATEEGTL